MQAFWELSTERSFGTSVGPIPWSRIVEYGCRAGLDDDMIEAFVTVIRAMDAKYVEWQSAESERESKQQEGVKKPSSR